MNGYRALSGSIFLGLGSSLPVLRKEIRNLNLVITDFDNTLIPSFAVVRPTLLLLQQKAQTSRMAGAKLEQLQSLLTKRKLSSVEVLSKRYARIICNLDERELAGAARQVSLGNPLFPSVYPVFGKFSRSKRIVVVSYGVRSIIRELLGTTVTAEVIARDLKKTGNVFSGIFVQNGTAKAFKNKAVKVFLSKRCKFIGIGDAEEDAGFLSGASVRICVNPATALVEEVKPQIILRDKANPWKDFQKFFL